MCILEKFQLGVGSAFDVADFLSLGKKNSSTFIIKIDLLCNLSEKKKFSKNTQEQHDKLSMLISHC